MRPILLLLLAAAALPAQPVSFGLKAGVPLTDFISAVGSGAVEHPQRYLLGPTVEVKLPWSFAFEGDILYRRVNYQSTVLVNPFSGGGTATSQVTSNAWEFPLLLKYRFAGMKFVRPYVDAGVSFDRLQGLTDTVSNAAGTLTNSASSGLKNSGTTGAVLGAGLDLHVLVLHISPEVRYTRWTSQHFNLANVLASQQNQAEFMVGITF